MNNQNRIENNFLMPYDGRVEVFNLPFYTEGPAVDSKGAIYCTNLTGGQVLKVMENGNVDEWARSACPNGQIILKNDDHLFCDSELGAIRRFSSKGIFIKDEIIGRCAGKKIHVPNDLIADKYGGIYFTDSIRENGCVGYYGRDGEEHILAEGLDYPNGLALSTDERSLYVAESYQNRVLKISMDRNRTELAVFADLPIHTSGKDIDNLPDGLQIDKDGKVWIAHYGMGALQVLSPTGELLQTINTKIKLTSNLFFGNDSLIVTGGKSEPGPGVIRLISKK